jgi:hypothetical protein
VRVLVDIDSIIIHRWCAQEFKLFSNPLPPSITQFGGLLPVERDAWDAKIVIKNPLISPHPVPELSSDFGPPKGFSCCPWRVIG